MDIILKRYRVYVLVFLSLVLIFLSFGVYFKFNLYQIEVSGEWRRVEVINVESVCINFLRGKGSYMSFDAIDINNSIEVSVLSTKENCCNKLKNGDIIDVLSDKNKKAIFGDNLILKSQFYLVLTFLLISVGYSYYFLKKYFL